MNKALTLPTNVWCALGLPQLRSSPGNWNLHIWLFFTSLSGLLSLRILINHSRFSIFYTHARVYRGLSNNTQCFITMLSHNAIILLVVRTSRADNYPSNVLAKAMC